MGKIPRDGGTRQSAVASGDTACDGQKAKNHFPIFHLMSSWSSSLNEHTPTYTGPVRPHCFSVNKRLYRYLYSPSFTLFFAYTGSNTLEGLFKVSDYVIDILEPNRHLEERIRAAQTFPLKTERTRIKSGVTPVSSCSSGVNCP